MRVENVRRELAILLERREFTSVNREKSMTSLSGSSTIELVGLQFEADVDSVFGAVNHDYVERELAWYESMSLNVNDIPGGTPAVWKAVADSDGFINSNYGWCVFSEENGSQLNNVVNELSKNPESRRGIMIYTRPQMWTDYNKNGRSDFMCTNTVQYLIRNGELVTIVTMRSNDAIFGYRNDFHWQDYCRNQLLNCLLPAHPSLKLGKMIWNAGSFHVYSKHFYLVEHFLNTGETAITKKEFDEKYPDSEFK